MTLTTYIVITVITNIVFGAIKYTFRSVPEEDQLRRALAISEAKALRMKERYEQQLAEANEQTKALEEKLKAVIQNRADITFMWQLAEEEILKKNMKELQNKNEESNNFNHQDYLYQNLF